METNVHRNALKSGYRLHWYQIERVLGQGGFGITYLAQDSNLDCPVAIKEYLPVEISMREATSAIYPVSGDWTQQYRWGLERFIAEARLLAKFKHPHIVRVLNVFEANNSAYMVMAYEEGESLQHIFKCRKTMDEAELLTILIPILNGLEKIHQSGFIHRDVKPANIFIRTDGSPVLLDFGSARLALGEKTLTLTALYSPGYAPMEQYYSKGDLQGPWTDIYALSATLYRAVAGVAPVDALNRSQGIFRGSTDPLKPALELGRDRYTDAFLKAIDHGLAFKPELRPQSIAIWRQEFSAPKSSPASMPSIPMGAEGTDVDTTNLAATLPSVTDDSQPMEDLERHQTQPESLRTMSGIWRWGITVGLCVGIVSVSMFLWLNRGSFFENSAPTKPVNARTPPLTVEPVVTDEPLSATETKVPPTETDQAKPPGAEPPTDIDVSRPQNNQEELSKNEQINDLLAAASRDIKAFHLTRPKGNNALEKYRAVLALQPDQQEATQGIREIMDRLLRLANEAIQHKDWAKALARIDQAATIEPEARDVAMARKALNIRKAEYEKQSADAQKEARSQDPKQNVKTLIDLAMQAMGRTEWHKTHVYLDRAAAIEPENDDIVLLRDELVSRRTKAATPPLAAQKGPTSEEAGSEEPRSAPAVSALVKIQKATSSLPTARPGETIRFYTEYSLTLPAGTKYTFLEATWVLTRNGKKMGKEGIVSRMVNPGVNTASTELILPQYTKPGRFMVEHKVQAADSSAVAKSHFSVVLK